MELFLEEVIHAGYDPVTAHLLTPRQAALYITGYYRRDHTAWRRMATLVVAIARAHGDKKITIDQVTPPWRKGGVSDEDARQLSHDRLMESVRKKEAAASKAIIERQRIIKGYLRSYLFSMRFIGT